MCYPSLLFSIFSPGRFDDPCQRLFARIPVCTFPMCLCNSNLVPPSVLRWSLLILNQPSRISAKRSTRAASVLCVEVHFDLRYSAVTFVLCLRNVRLAFALCTCAFWICHTFPWFVRVDFVKYCLFRSSLFAIVQPYRSRCVSTFEWPC